MAHQSLMGEVGCGHAGHGEGNSQGARPSANNVALQSDPAEIIPHEQVVPMILSAASGRVPSGQRNQRTDLATKKLNPQRNHN
jgi:hypothetical protein